MQLFHQTSLFLNNNFSFFLLLALILTFNFYANIKMMMMMMQRVALKDIEKVLASKKK